MFKKFLHISLVVILLVLLSAGVVWASDGPTAESNAIAIDTVWLIVAAVLVFLMQAGFAMVETGFTRSKNAGNIIMKNTMDFAAGSLIYWMIGFGLMFGVDSMGLIGTTGFAMNGTFEHLGLTVPIPAFLIFQTVFAAATATIVSGAMAERTKFSSYFLYSIVLTAFIYPVVGHWAWGGGWLSEIGYIDFAGSSVVHSVGGWAALVGAVVLGPRLGKYGKDGKVNAIPGHSITLGALGVFILWFGWFGFNPGSTLSGTTPDIAHIAVTTNLAGSAGAVLTLIVTWLKYGKPDVSLTLNGALGGLVGITAGCQAVTPVGAVIIGALSGTLLVFSIEFIDRVLKIDDPVGAVTVHGVCGAFGTVMVGFFAQEGGLFYGGGASQLITQLIGVGAIFAWTTVTAFILFKTIKSTVGLRVSPEEEEEGLDIGEHGISAYGDFVIRTTSTKSTSDLRA